MKTYKIEYFTHDKSIPNILIEITQTGIYIGNRVGFLKNKLKIFQDNFKNDKCNGISKSWYWSKPKNSCFQNQKKSKTQGIKINFLS